MKRHELTGDRAFKLGALDTATIDSVLARLGFGPAMDGAFVRHFDGLAAADATMRDDERLARHSAARENAAFVIGLVRALDTIAAERGIELLHVMCGVRLDAPEPPKKSPDVEKKSDTHRAANDGHERHDAARGPTNGPDRRRRGSAAASRARDGGGDESNPRRSRGKHAPVAKLDDSNRPGTRERGRDPEDFAATPSARRSRRRGSP